MENRIAKHIEDIQTAESILDEVRMTSSTNDKLFILELNKDNETLKKVLEYTYNPFKKYGVTDMDIIHSINSEEEVEGEDIWTILDKLAGNNINNNLRMELSAYIRKFYDISFTLEGIVLKDLRLGINSKSINKIWKGLIPTSETEVSIKPMLASKFDFEKPPVGNFVVTEKLDGIRCVAICKTNEIQLFTRQGKKIEGCIEVENDLMELVRHFKCEFVLDGELLAKNCTYENVYKETTKRVKNKNEVKTGIYFMAFDLLDMLEFENQNCTTEYIKRLDVLKHFRSRYKFDSVKFINPIYEGNDTKVLLSLLDKYKDLGAEGLMVNLAEGYYEFKRSKQILKVKVMQTVDLKVVGFEEGTKKNKGKLGALLVEYKDNIVGVGSGFTDLDREFIWNNQDLLLGRVVEISYFEETTNKQGTKSLRFPVFKVLREEGKEVSYN